MIQTAHTFEQKKAAFDRMAERVPVSLNYHDLQMQSAPDYWDAYQVHSFEDGQHFALGGISPEQSLNVYSTTEASFEKMTDHLLNQFGPTTPLFFRGNLFGVGELGFHSRLGEDVQYIQPTQALKAVAANFPEPSSETQLRRATRNDQPTVAAWFEAYNQETDSSYSIPTAETIESRQYYLLENTEGAFIGGAAHTFTHEGRFWVGRLYVLPEHRRTGMASQLQNHLAQIARKDSKEIHLLVHCDNTAAMSFYKKIGFQPNGRFFYAKTRA